MKTNKIAKIFMLSAVIALSTVSTTLMSSNTAAFAAEASAIEEIKFDYEQKTVSVGEVFQITPTLSPSDSSSSEISWSSSDTRVASVSNGKVTTYRSGGTIIRATNKAKNSVAVAFISVGVPYSEWRFVDELNGVRRDYTSYYNYYDTNGYYPYYLSTNSKYYEYNPRYYYDYYDPIVYNTTVRDYYYSPYYYNNPYYNNAYYYTPYDYPRYTVEYTRVLPNKPSTVLPGKADSPSALAIEFKASATTSIEEEIVDFSSFSGNQEIIVNPKKVALDQTNTLNFGQNILPRLEKFGVKSINYNLSLISVSVYPQMEIGRNLKLSLTNVSPQGEMKTQWNKFSKIASSKIWLVQSNGNPNSMDLKFKLDKQYSASALQVLVWNDSEQTFEALDQDEYSVFSSTKQGEKTYYLTTKNNNMSAGIYAVVKK